MANIITSSNITISNSNYQNITYTNNNNSIMHQDTIKQIRNILRNIMQQQQFNSNMRRAKLDDSFCSTEVDE